MKVDAKYLPSKQEQELFINNRINENQKQVLGGVLEIKMAELRNDGPTIEQVEHGIKQLMENIDLYEKELASL